MKDETAGGSPPECADPSDREQLTRFIRGQDQNAFRALIARHGPMVLAVCRGILRRQQDAEDACQATFLVLAEQARRIRRRNSLASWLHGTAYRICLKARARIQRRREEVMGDLTMIVDQSLDEIADQHAQGVIHQELNRMPEKYRAALVIWLPRGEEP